MFEKILLHCHKAKNRADFLTHERRLSQGSSSKNIYDFTGYDILPDITKSGPSYDEDKNNIE